MFNKDPIFWWAAGIFVLALVLMAATRDQFWLVLMIGSYLLRPTLASLGLARRHVDERQMSIQYRSGNIAFVAMIITCIVLAVNLNADGNPAWEMFIVAIVVGLASLGGRPISPFLQAKRNLAHKLVFEKIIGLTGGRIRLFLSGGAPLSKDIAEFFHAIGLLILEGYGLTETSPVISLNAIGHMKFGSVGKPIPGVEVRIADDGEILTRGPHVMKGYYKMPAETAEVFDGDWFRTGDIGRFDEEGFLVITDRKKDIIVTSGGRTSPRNSLRTSSRPVPTSPTPLSQGTGGNSSQPSSSPISKRSRNTRSPAASRQRTGSASSETGTSSIS